MKMINFSRNQVQNRYYRIKITQSRKCQNPGKFDIYLQKVTECYSKLKEKIMKRVHLAAREEELLDTFGKRQICVRAKQRNQMNSLPCAQKCNQLFADMKGEKILNLF